MACNKRINGARSLVESGKCYVLDDALALLMVYSEKFKSKFDETVEVIFKLGVDPRHSDHMVRGVVPMPHGLGKKVVVAVFTKAERIKEAFAAGADIAGAEELVEKVRGGEVNFDVCIATPDFMAKMTVLGKILGIKGLMPNSKLGTVDDNIAIAVKNAKSGQVEYKLEKAGLIHAGVGKISFATSALKANIMALYNAVLNAKPASAKGIYMQKMYISTTHGPSIALDLKDMML